MAVINDIMQPIKKSPQGKLPSVSASSAILAAVAKNMMGIAIKNEKRDAV